MTELIVLFVKIPYILGLNKILYMQGLSNFVLQLGITQQWHLMKQDCWQCSRTAWTRNPKNSWVMSWITVWFIHTYLTSYKITPNCMYWKAAFSLSWLYIYGTLKCTLNVIDSISRRSNRWQTLPLIDKAFIFHKTVSGNHAAVALKWLKNVGGSSQVLLLLRLSSCEMGV